MENILYIAAVVAAVWVIFDIVTKQKRMPVLQKILWVVAALVFSLITGVVYFFVVKKGKF